MSYKAVLFDFDYTLGDATTGIVESFGYALGELGFPLPSELEIKKTVGLSLEETFFRLTGNRETVLVERFKQLFKTKADEVMTPNTVLYHDTIPLLKKLKQTGIKTAVVTGKYHYRIVQILQRFDIEPLIDVIVGLEDVKRQKPDPEGLLLAAKTLQIPPEGLLYVGDSEVDAAAALAAKVNFCAVLTGATEKDVFTRYPSVFMANDLSELITFLKL